LLGLHYAKMALDDTIENAGRQGIGATYKRGLLEIKNKLLGVMDQLSPDYAQARQVFAHFSPSVEAINTGVVSRIANLPPEKIGEASRMLFKPDMSPQVVQKTRGLFAQAGLESDYNALLRGYLQDSFEQSGRQFKTGGGMVGQAPSWRAQMLGNPAQERVLKAAMTRTSGPRCMTSGTYSRQWGASPAGETPSPCRCRKRPRIYGARPARE
jgi:hypothetical protein